MSCIRSTSTLEITVTTPTDLTIVDAHHHLWDLEALPYPWLMARGVRRFFGDPTPIQKNYLLSDLRRDIGALPVAGSVHVQVGVDPDRAVDETAWIQSVADNPTSRGMPDAIVAFCDLAARDAPAQLERHCAYANVRGVRQIVGRSAEEDARTGSARLLDDPRWRANLARLAALELSFDLQLIPAQMRDVCGLLARLPDLRVALCHCGSPWDRSAAGLTAWRNGMTALAALPNVHCKLSGFGMYDPDWNADRVRDLVRFAIDVFGPQRCMFGSNFPVDKLYRDYQSLIADYLALVEDFSPDEQRAMLGNNARAFYRFGPA